jgi:hypothetical protein
MKKILIIGLMVAAALQVQAQQFVATSMFNGSVAVTNATTITYGDSGTFTNEYAVQKTATLMPFADAILFPPSTPVAPVYADTTYTTVDLTSDTNTVAKAELQTTHTTTACIITSMKAQASGDSLVTFKFVAVPDGTLPAVLTTFSTTATCSGTTVVNVMTPVPAYLFGGCKSIRLYSIAKASEARASSATILAVKLCQWVK